MKTPQKIKHFAWKAGWISQLPNQVQLNEKFYQMVHATSVDRRRKQYVTYCGLVTMLKKFGKIASSHYLLKFCRIGVSWMWQQIYRGEINLGLDSWNSLSRFAGEYGRTRMNFGWEEKERRVEQWCGMRCTQGRSSELQMNEIQSIRLTQYLRFFGNLQVKDSTK